MKGLNNISCADCNWNLGFRLSVWLMAVGFWLLPMAVFALPTSYQLPIKLAVEASLAAVQTCQSRGYNVTATVVTREGLRQAVVRGDGATPHTIENSFNKAYTIITLGPIQQVTSTVEIVQSIRQPANPVGSWPIPASPLPGLTFTAGGIAMKVGNEIVAGIGVSGAPMGTLDHFCAEAGIRKISELLTS